MFDFLLSSERDLKNNEISLHLKITRIHWRHEWFQSVVSIGKRHYGNTLKNHFKKMSNAFDFYDFGDLLKIFR